MPWFASPASYPDFVTAFSSLPVGEVIGEPAGDDRGRLFTSGTVAQFLREGLELSELTVARALDGFPARRS